MSVRLVLSQAEGASIIGSTPSQPEDTAELQERCDSRKTKTRRHEGPLVHVGKSSHEQPATMLNTNDKEYLKIINDGSSYLWGT